MKTVIQRVSKASVTINSREKREITRGLVILAGFGKHDSPGDFEKMFNKIKSLRIFPDEEGKLDKSAEDIKGEILIVSQFTLYGNCKKGRRPDFTKAASFESGKKLYEQFLATARISGLTVKSGEFGADMLVEIHNDGPVTIILDSEEL